MITVDFFAVVVAVAVDVDNVVVTVAAVVGVIVNAVDRVRVFLFLLFSCSGSWNDDATVCGSGRMGILLILILIVSSSGVR